MAKILLIAATVALTCVTAEPPAPRQYLPPSQGGYSGQPSSQYGAPSSFGRSGNGVPSNQYGAPSAFGRSGNGVPSNQYGAPSAFGRSSGAPSNQYGAPSDFGRFGNGVPSNQYGAPSASGRSGSPSTQYGAPAASGQFGGSRALSTQYGAPGGASRFGGSSALSAQYGAPGASSRFGAASSLSSQYGAPSSRYGAPSSQYASGGGYARGGYSAQDDDMAEPANYQYSYEVQDAESGSEFGHDESRQDEYAQGSYRVLLPDGRLQIVEYEADQEGYKPQIRYEDTGRGYPSGPQHRGGPGGPY